MFLHPENFRRIEILCCYSRWLKYLLVDSDDRSLIIVMYIVVEWHANFVNYLVSTAGRETWWQTGANADTTARTSAGAGVIVAHVGQATGACKHIRHCRNCASSCSLDYCTACCILL
jgi:hypothetical protein